MAENETEIVTLSAIEHYAYCPRQYALIFLEGVFEDNVFTLQGQAVHERADDEELTTREAGVRIERALPLWSDQHGLLGKADTVEFRADGSVWPVEYKRGARKHKCHDDLQVCAQALCLEEMLGVEIPRGMLFYHASHRSREVAFDAALRAETLAVVAAIRALQQSPQLPPPLDDARCAECSLQDACQPELVGAAGRHTADRLFDPEEEAE